MQQLAHIRFDESGKRTVQTVEEHCRHAAFYAGKALKEVHLSEAGYLAGLVHDAGKCKEEFQRYLLGNGGARGTVNHTFAGCRMLMEHFHQGEDFRSITAELLSYAVGAHHGLFDCMDEAGRSGFLHRMEKKEIGYEESRNHFLSGCAGWPELEERFQKAHRELETVYDRIADLAEKSGENEAEDTYFYLGLTARLLLSAVIEGDRRDTAEFMNDRPGEADIPDRKRFWSEHLDGMEAKLAAFKKDTPINQARAQISDQCRAFAAHPGGVYRLNVPTGGGKTLSALRYALAHAARWEKQRIIFVTPLLSILEQNADVIRTYIGDDAIILEHHSNVMETGSSQDELDERELAVDSWHAPVIITTLVQLLNTLFLGKTTSIRRFQALCHAVVVIDEVQTVPNHMLSLFNLAVNFLSSICGTTFLLCSATQPCYEKTEHPLVLSGQADVVPFDEAIWAPFRRTKIRDAGPMKLDEIPDFVKTVLEETDSLLIICNKKGESEALFGQLQTQEYRCFHLSAAMCMAHRRDVLSGVSRSLERTKQDGVKTICVSTQVMEAGVDLSFGRVIRLAAGMDSVVQAAGRCNRNGEDKALSPVYIVQCSDENLGRLAEIQMAKTVTTALLHAFRCQPERFGGDLASDAAIRFYYRKLFQEESLTEGYQDYAVKDESYTLLSLLSENNKLGHPPVEAFTLNQAFKLAGGLFQVFDDSTEDVVVPYGEGEKLLSELATYPSPVRPEQLHRWNEKAKPYTISLYQYQKEKLAFGLREVRGVLALEADYYDQNIGLVMNREDGLLEV